MKKNTFALDGWKLLLLLTTSAVLFRLFTLEIIEDSGDGMFYWQAIQKLYYGIDYGTLNHWTTRFGLILPELALVSILGTHPLVYYVLPFMLSVFQVVLVYALGREVHGKEAGILSAAFLLLYPEMVRASSQLLPGIFSGTFLLLVVYCLVRFYRSGGKKILWLLGGVVLMFMAYETKITNLFFLPGVLFALWLVRRKLSDPLLFGTLLFGLFILECLVYYHFTGDFMARAHAITGHHLDHGQLKPVSFFYLFFRWIRPGPHFILVLLLTFWGAYTMLKGRATGAVHMVVLPVLSFIFFLTFTIKNVSPLIPATTFQIRYWNVALPLMMLVSSMFIVQSSLMEKYRHKMMLLFRGTVVILLLVYGFVYHQNIYRHSVCHVQNVYGKTNKAFFGGIPVVAGKKTSNIVLRMQNIQKNRDEGMTLQQAVASTGMTMQKYRSFKHDVNRVRKVKRLLEGSFVNLDLLDDAGIHEYPDLLEYDSVDVNGKKIVTMRLKNDDIRNTRNKLTKPGQPVYLLHRRPVDLEKMTVSTYMEYLEAE
ncbi:MAG: ArnT family glycosyltransferase [Spirochaetota bacterium]